MSLNFRNTALESLSFGVLFFAKEIAAFNHGKNLQIQLQDIGTLLLAIFSMAALYFFLTRKRQSLSILICLSLGPLVSYGIRFVLANYLTPSVPLAWALVALYFLTAGLLISLFRNPFYLFCKNALLFGSPLALVLIGSLLQIGWDQERTNRQFTAQNSINAPSKKELTLFLIFDEWDPCVIFAEENRELFPVSNRLRRQSFYANRAYPSGSDTFPSITSMTLGRFVNAISLPQVFFKDTNESVIWPKDPNVLFRQIAERGKEIGSVGGMIVDYGKTFFPYIKMRSTAGGHSFWQSYFDHFLRSFLLWIPEARRGCCPMTVRYSRFTFENDVERLFDLIDKQECDFIFAHFNGGHFPTLNGSWKQTFSYLKNLQLVDELLGKLQTHLERKGLWDHTNCLLTSDHWWRIHMSLNEGLTFNPTEMNKYLGKIDHTVPLFIKLKGQSEGWEYSEPTSTLFLKDLVLQLIDGKISSPNDLQAFFDSKARGSEIAKWEYFEH